MSCPSKIRPFPNDTELACEKDEHVSSPVAAGDDMQHRAVLKDYAYPGSETVVTWQYGDRREFTGDWSGYCLHPSPLSACMLPAGHHGDHAL